MGTLDLNVFKRKFIDEAHKLLSNLDNCLIELEKQPENTQSINEAFRIMHTIKGAGGMYGFEKLVEITHEMESLYSVVRDKQLVVSQQLLDLTFITVDHIRALLSDEECKTDENQTTHQRILAIVSQMRQTDIEQPSPKQIIPTPKIGIQTTYNILFYPHEQLVTRAINLVYVFQDLFALGEWRIYHKPFDSEDNQYWSIFLSTDKGYEEIEDALLFVLDDCKITKIGDFNIFDTTEFNKWVDVSQKTNRTVSYIETNPTSSPQEINPTISKERQSNEVVYKNQTTNYINVSAAKLDSLMYLVSELVTTKSELIISLKHKNYIGAINTAEKIEKLSKQFSDNVLNIRLVSLHEMLSGFKRLVRDLSKQLDKSIDFVTVGEETELDKNIIDNIGEPIMHLIRNCIDHGIEAPSKRLEQGKSENGTVRIEATKQGNFVYITISDDGNGIDTNYVYQKAIDKGFISPGTELHHKDILDLIFLPGFSTAQTLTNVSGRGVGMDIVKRKIQEIRGEIAIESTMGKGTTFTLKLRQSISIIETLLIQSAETTFAIPVADVEACLLEPSESFTQTSNMHFSYNNNLIPYINLGSKYSKGNRELMPETEKVVIINRNDKTYAIITDKIIGEYQAVIKPLGEAFSNVDFLSGVSILGDGSIALLVDTEKLWFEI